MNGRIQKKHTAFRMGLILTLVMGGLILLGFFWTPYAPTAMDASAMLAPPSLTHPFGTDNFGRDLFSRVLEGAGVTFLIALITIAAAGLVGMAVGAFAAYRGGLTGEILMRLNDALASFPSVLLALVLIALFGPGTVQMTAALIIAFVPSFVRVSRGEFLRLKDTFFVRSARLSGVKAPRLLFAHVLPNAAPSLLSAVTVGFNNAVLAEAGMSYLGLGVTPPAPSLGRMLSEGQAYLTSAPWCVLFPGLFIILMLLGVSLLGDGLLTVRGGGR